MPEDSPTQVPLIGFALVCSVGAALGQLSVVGTGGPDTPLVWLPVGLLAGALVVSSRRQWPALLVIAFLIMSASALVHGETLATSAGLGATYAGVAVLAARLLRHFTDTGFDLSSLTHLTALFVVSVVTPIVGGLALTEVARLAPGRTTPFAEVWLASWATGTLGLAVGGALVFGWRQYPDGVASPPRWRVLEGLVTLAGLAILSEAIFGGLLPQVFRAPTYLMPLLLLAAFRLGPVGTAAAMATVNTVALPNTMLGHGPFVSVNASPFELVLRAQIVGIMATVSFLLLASNVAERRRIAQERVALVAKLQQALIEIKTLRGFIPICAWCHKVRDDEGFWQEIESYLHSHTEAVFSHGICPACHEREDLAIEAHQATRDAAGHAPPEP